MPRTASSSVDAKIVGLGIRRAREQQGLTQAMLATRLQVSAAYVQKVEAGKANPTVGQLANIAAALDCSMEVELKPLVRTDPLAEFVDR